MIKLINSNAFTWCIFIVLIGCMYAYMYVMYRTQPPIPNAVSNCMGCHGPDGVSPIPGYPTLARQDKEYLINRMKYFRENEKMGDKSTPMLGMASDLTDDEIEEIANYYSKM